MRSFGPLLICALAIVSLAGVDRRPILLREYQVDNAGLVEVSKDGRFLLTRGTRKVDCKQGHNACDVQTLAVYEAVSGKQLGEYASGTEDHLEIAAFTEDATVVAVEGSLDKQQNKSLGQDGLIRSRDARKGLSDIRQEKFLQHELRWNPVSNVRESIPLSDAESFTPVCFADRNHLLAVTAGSAKDADSPELAIIDGLEIHHLQQPRLRSSSDVGSGYYGERQFTPRMSANCKAWKSGEKYLVQSAEANHRLFWVSTRFREPARSCLAFPEEQVLGYAVSPDGTLIAVVTGVGKLPVLQPAYHVYLNIVSQGCTLLRRTELLFPEHPTRRTLLFNPKVWFWDHVAFSDLFANRMAISPDNKMLAITYGVVDDPNGVAFFGLYSSADGRRLAAVKGDEYKCGLLHGAILNDELHCETAPITGAVQFSPDSRTLFATSEHVHQLDVSALQ